MSFDNQSRSLIATLAARYSSKGQSLSFFQNERWLYLLSYDNRTAQPKESMRMALTGDNRAKIEVFYTKHDRWISVKEGGARFRARKNLLDRNIVFDLALSMLETWRTVSEYVEYEEHKGQSNIGNAKYYRIGDGVLGEYNVNSILPRYLTPAAVIGLREGTPRSWGKYPLKRISDATLHIYERPALPTFSSGTICSLEDRLGLGVPLYDESSNMILAEVMPTWDIPAVFLLQDISTFASSKRQALVDSLLSSVALVISTVRSGRTIDVTLKSFLASVIAKDFATLGANTVPELGYGATPDSTCISKCLEVATHLNIS